MNPAAPAVPPDRLAILLRLVMFIVLAWLGRAIFPLPLLVFNEVLAATLGIFAAGAVANAIVVRIYEGGRLSDAGLAWDQRSAREIGMGAALGAGGAAVILGGAWVAGWASFVPAEASEHPWASVLYTGGLLLFGAMGEEMIFRGYAFQLLIRVVGPFAAILPTSILFGLAHLLNPNPSALGIANTVLWGCLLGYAFWRTGALWLPIGLHYGWNLALFLFGENLSGLTIGVTGYALSWNVDGPWNGGAYGVEASLLTTLIAVVLFVALRRMTKPAAPAGPRQGAE